MSLNKEKLESELYQQYQQAIDNLENGDVETGKAALKKLMENPAIINQDDKRILYGIYMSLAETLAQSTEVTHKFEALYYYNLSNSIIENCWQIYRKMAIIFRQIGMLPKALNTIIKAFQLCTQPLMHSPILYQICSICFLMNETGQFFKYFNLIPHSDNFKLKFKEISDYLNQGILTDFVEELLHEKSLIQEKLQLIPQNSNESEFFNQQYVYNLKLDLFDLKKFFKKIKNMLQVNVNVEPKKQDFFLNDKSLLSNTQIIISKKLTMQKKKNATKEQVKESQAPVKQSERQKSKKTKQQLLDQQQFVLDAVLNLNFKNIIDLTKEIEGSNMFESKSTSKTIQEKQEKQESSVAKFLLQRMSDKKYLTVIAVLIDLIFLLLKEYQPTFIDEQEYKNALRGLINCVVWGQYSTNFFTHDPMIKLRLLELSYDELNFRCKLKKAKSPEQHNKIKNYSRFISNLKLELLQTDIRQILNDDIEIQNYLEKYYNLMVHIHCDINFFIGRIAQQSANELNNKELLEFVQEKLKAAKVQISNSSPNQSQQINQIISQWEMKEQKLEDNEKIRAQINFVVDFLKQNQSGEIVQQFATICLNQFYFAQSNEDLKIIHKFIEPILLQLENVQQINNTLTFLFLKLALIYSQMELESSGFVSHFLRTLISEIKCQRNSLLFIEILKLKHLNIPKLLNLLDISQISKQFVLVKLELKDKNKQLIQYFKANIQSDTELNYYLLHLLDFKIEQTPRFKFTKKQIQIEVPKNDPKFDSPISFSCASDDDMSQAEQFSKQYTEIGLTSDQIGAKFKIMQKYYQFQHKTVEFLENHQVQINVGDPLILDHTKRLAKENVKQDVGFRFKQICMSIGEILFTNYYFLPDFNRELSEAELEFIGFYLPSYLKYKKEENSADSFLLTKIKDTLLKSIEPEVAEFSEQLNNYIFGKQAKQLPPQPPQISYKSNLFYLLHKAEEQNKQVNLKYFCLALAYKDSSFLWNQFYLYIFSEAKNQLLSKTTTEIDWFLSQKKAQALVNKNPKLSYLYEYRFIMDLLKAQQRQNEYQISQSDKSYQKTQQIYEILFKGKQFIIPDDALDLEYNFRAMMLYEKKVVRKFRLVTPEKIGQNIDNLLKLKKLIAQMKEYDLDYFFESKDGEFEVEQDIYINLYKFIRRFIKLNLFLELNEIIQIIKEKLPSLLQPCQLQYQFEFPVEKRAYKYFVGNKYYGQQVMYDKQQLDLILNNILNYFIINISKFNKKKVQRYIIEAYYYATHLKFHSSASVEDAFQQIQVIFLPNSKDLVYYYLKIDKYQSEKDEVLQNYYYHDLIFSYQKSKILKLIIKILLVQQKFKDIYLLFEKLNKTHDLRLYQACMGLMEKYELIEDKILIRDIIYKIESFRRTNDLFKQEGIQGPLNELYVKWYEKDQISQGQNEFQQESKEKRLEKGKKLMEDYKSTKRKATKPKPQSQQQLSAQKQPNQSAVDDIEQYINKDPIQQYNDDDNL